MPGGPNHHYILPAQPYANDLYRINSSENGERPSKRPRASKPKVKSGCITCKARRVKCDETKPQCLRCQKFGHACDGYAPEPPHPRGLFQLQPRIPAMSLYNPSIAIHTTEEESQYFQAFVEHTSHELSGFFDESFWARLVLQESHHVAAIRHAVIALGALGKSLDTAAGPHLKVNILQSIDRRHHEQAVFHYLKAIQALNQYLSSSNAPQLRNALIACLLFVCFETFQGSYALAIQQTYGGLKILRSYYQGKPGSRPWIPRRKSLRNVEICSLSKNIQARTGSILHDPLLMSHVEEYLESEPPTRITMVEGQIPTTIIEPSETPESFCSDTSARHTPIPISQLEQTDLNKKIQQTTKALNKTPDGFLSTNGSVNSSNINYINSRPAESMNGSTSTIPTPASTPTTPQAPMSSQNSTTHRAATSKRRFEPRTTTSSILKNDLHVEQVLIQTFVRLDGQGLFFGITPGIPPLIWDVHGTWHLPIPTVFPNFQSAQCCWDFLMDRTLQFYRRTLFNRTFSPATCESDEEIATQYATYTKQLSSFERAFRPILDAAISPAGAVTNAPALILSLLQKCTSITFSQALGRSELIFDSFLPSFRYINNTCAILIRDEITTKLPKNPRFSLEVGIVPPLFITATKCRNSTVRREAIDLLLRYPRQEGMWDSVLSARIGMWVMRCEEQGIDSPDLPERSQSVSPRDKSKDCEDENDLTSLNTCSVLGAYSLGQWDDQRLPSGTEGATVACSLPGERAETTSFANDDHQTSAKTKASERQSSTRYGSGTGNSRIRATQTDSFQDKDQTEVSIVPEESRVLVTAVNFNLPDRYIKVKCQKALSGPDGRKEERETIIAW